ncbi:MAG: GNAT family N-acetyltransferase [Thermoplasmatota archaeon]
MIKFRDYDEEKDKESVHRIWNETGWLEEGKEKQMDDFIECSKEALVAEVNGEAECLVLTAPGTIRYLDEDIPLSGVTSVTTSRVARKQGLAGKLTAVAVSRSSEDGYYVSGLGMFEQGFYNKLGFGTGSYEHWLSFDPAALKIDKKPRIPSRITSEDWKEVYESLKNRKKGHGFCTLETPKGIKVNMERDKKSFGLGYFDGPNGELTHHVYFGVKDVERGPYWVMWMSYQNYNQYLELLGLIKNLCDQVRLIHMSEPPNIQLQDLIDRPFKSRQITEKSKYENRMIATAWWQMRILDLKGCIENTHLNDGGVTFNLELEDPIENLLDEESPWKGISGEYVVTLGHESKLEKGKDLTHPTLKASIGAFTRMWLGVRPATGISVTDNLTASEELLKALDHVLCIPRPLINWNL